MHNDMGQAQRLQNNRMEKRAGAGPGKRDTLGKTAGRAEDVKSGVVALIVWIAWLVLGICNIYADGKLPIVTYITGSVCYALWFKLLERSMRK